MLELPPFLPTLTIVSHAVSTCIELRLNVSLQKVCRIVGGF